MISTNMIGMIKSFQNVRSNISEIYTSRKEKHNNSENGFIRYIRCDMLVQIGFLIGILSIMIIFSGLLQLISLNSVPNSLFMIAIGGIGVLFTKNVINKGLNKMF